MDFGRNGRLISVLLAYFVCRVRTVYSILWAMYAHWVIVANSSNEFVFGGNEFLQLELVKDTV